VFPQSVTQGTPKIQVTSYTSLEFNTSLAVCQDYKQKIFLDWPKDLKGNLYCVVVLGFLGVFFINYFDTYVAFFED
jgi:hypothetical protein